MKRITSFIFVIFIAFTAISTISAQVSSEGTFRQEGIASWYGTEFDGRLTASGEVFDSTQFTAAHPSLPFGTILTVTNTYNDRQVTVKVNDRGPFVATRIIDLSMAAADYLDMLTTGTALVIVEAPAIAVALQVPQTVAAAPVQAPVQAAPVQPAPVQAPVQQAPVQPVQAPVQQAPVQPVQAPVQQQVPAQPVQAPVQQAPVQQVQPPVQPVQVPVQPVAPVIQPVQPVIQPAARAATIIGGIPATGTGKTYRLQVGAFRVPRNAIDAFDKLKAAGLDPAYERLDDLYRVVLAKLRPEDIPFIATVIYAAGFPEAIIREER